ncbi:hypothetical protein [Paraburkholderia sp. SG-MS1]|uniref:hypothetical protein n=1 Tax=Paraburkholderia sp. SG-MS1 TaxID=2023741 RepID=UPI001446B58A|nr:hypothetical protein [Paraburkholderia sp. SG-MS1]
MSSLNPSALNECARISFLAPRRGAFTTEAHGRTIETKQDATDEHHSRRQNGNDAVTALSGGAFELLAPYREMRRDGDAPHE